MSRDGERSDEIAKKIRREKAATCCDEMGRRHMMLSPSSTGTLNTVTPCAACKLLRRRCAEECPFSPYFSPHEPQKFAAVHRVFGASNVSKMLTEVPESQRADTANSLVYEANLRLRDPVYGCMGAISALQQQIQTLQAELNAVRNEILRFKYRQPATNNHMQSDVVVPHSSAATAALVVSVVPPPTLSSSSTAAAPPDPSPPPLPPPSLVVPSSSSSSSSTSSLFTTPTSTTTYSSISSDTANVHYFEQI
ncbi:LOB domain-containing protein 15-like isoform X2 [Rhodamnia argentea]|uniref:LOB domain-containing protein 15-like isoform X2 n=1 Tax=Rhodamnia argentea TaxID=178133 RepID=A0A8B8PT24_9MYRT|nr:LOB domain-containing protein 15-like isoform X2 [Rhodamnia argentea]